MKTFSFLLSVLLIFAGQVSVVTAELALAADDFDAVASDFESFASDLNQNFANNYFGIVDLGGNPSPPNTFFGNSLGSDDLINAADHLRAAAVPEPTSFTLFSALGLLTLPFRRRNSRGN